MPAICQYATINLRTQKEDERTLPNMISFAAPFAVIIESSPSIWSIEVAAVISPAGSVVILKSRVLSFRPLETL